MENKLFVTFVILCAGYVIVFYRTVSTLFPEQTIVPDTESFPYVLSDTRVWSQTELLAL